MSKPLLLIMICFVLICCWQLMCNFYFYCRPEEGTSLVPKYIVKNVFLSSWFFESTRVGPVFLTYTYPFSSISSSSPFSLSSSYPILVCDSTNSIKVVNMSHLDFCPRRRSTGTCRTRRATSPTRPPWTRSMLRQSKFKKSHLTNKTIMDQIHGEAK